MIKFALAMKPLSHKPAYLINIQYPKCFDGLQSLKNLSADRV